MYSELEKEQLAVPAGYEAWWLSLTEHLSGIYPYQDAENPGVCSLDIEPLIAARKERGGSLQLDSTALIAKVSLPFLLGNRTLIEGFSRAPWMSYPDNDGGWHITSLPKHDVKKPDPAKFVLDLKAALLEEVRLYIKGSKTVGILLSGGMDSRVVAGVVRALQEEMNGSFDVVGLTWGAEDSRDVIYARRISERFGWGVHNYKITAETLFDNIECMARMGAEVSPFHLHAMPQVAMTDGIDVVLAGSYGDSIGRGEFSGRNLGNIESVFPKKMDRFGVVKLDAVERAKKELLGDVLNTPHVNSEVSLIRRHEIEQQSHYLRRMLQSCMQVIAKDKRFYQVFTSPAVFGQMWSLDPSIRNDDWYKRLLPLLPGDLLSIPWARTGRRYDQPNEVADEYLKSYHSYGHWLRTELKSDVLAKINSETIRGLGFFNESGLDFALKTWSLSSTKSINRLDELFSWLATLHDFIEIYGVGENNPASVTTWRDHINAIRGGAYAQLYINVRGRLRR